MAEGYNYEGMPFAPQQNWRLYEDRTGDFNRHYLRSLTPMQKFELYQELFDMLWGARRESRNLDKLYEWHWKQKLEVRRKMVEAFKKMDQLKNERCIANNAS